MNTYEKVERYLQDRWEELYWMVNHFDLRTPVVHATFWITVIVLGLLFWTWIFCTFAPMVKYVFADTASYYTYESCRKEGTSGVWTASGEKFNENYLTCAMPDRKMFGKYFKVTNLRNGKSIVVKCNDYGPNRRLVKQGRIIDLSKGAFLRIASLKTGVINVKIERVK